MTGRPLGLALNPRRSLPCGPGTVQLPGRPGNRSQVEAQRLAESVPERDHPNPGTEAGGGQIGDGGPEGCLAGDPGASGRPVHVLGEHGPESLGDRQRAGMLQMMMVKELVVVADPLDHQLRRTGPVLVEKRSEQRVLSQRLHGMEQVPDLTFGALGEPLGSRPEGVFLIHPGGPLRSRLRICAGGVADRQ